MCQESESLSAKSKKLITVGLKGGDSVDQWKARFRAYSYLYGISLLMIFNYTITLSIWPVVFIAIGTGIDKPNEEDEDKKNLYFGIHVATIVFFYNFCDFIGR